MVIIITISCSNTLKEIEQLSDTEIPNTYGQNIDFTYSDSAKMRFRLIAPELIDKYQEKVHVIREFPKGVEVFSFDENENQNTKIVADYAIQFVDSNLWKIEKNVIATTADSQALYTQEAYWDANKKRFYTDSAFKFDNKGNIINGVGFESDDRFEKIIMRKTYGVVYIDASYTKSDSLSLSDSIKNVNNEK